MYSQQDLDDAVAAGALDAGQVAALRTFVDQRRQSPSTDEEQVRLITSFNDIFVAIATTILLIALAWIGQDVGRNLGLAIEGEGPSFLAPLAVALASWPLALVFTARRRMALPSILLTASFVGSVILTVMFAGALFDGQDEPSRLLVGLTASAAGLVGAGAALLHWRRFHVPITVAAGAAGIVATVMALAAAIIGPDKLREPLLGLSLVLGLVVFGVAMKWDGSDRSRLTRRSDVAFWLHLLAAPMIVHPVFTLLGLSDGTATTGEALGAIALYVALGLAALAIDRRALLVSALAYVLFALNALFREAGAIELNVALTALVIGSALLTLSAFWHQARQMVVRPLPQRLRDRLPTLDRLALAA